MVKYDYSNLNIKLTKDHKFYLENFCKIKTKSGGLAPFILNEAQKDLYNTLNRNNRVIILKARQLGFSTAVTGYFYVDTITNPVITTALIGYNSELVSELLEKIKTFYRTTPVELRPTIRYNSKYEISFPKIDSKILILPSSENVGSGYTLNRCLITELAKWEKPEEKMMSLMPAIPLVGKAVIETSPKGVGNLFHRMWASENEWAKKKYPWWWVYTREEIEIIKKQIDDPYYFAQEYNCSFLASGRNVFGHETLAKVEIGLIDINGELKEGEVVKNYYKKDKWIIYKDPEPGEMYVLGGDVAEGVFGGDYSVAVIFNRRTGEEVAFFREYISPDKFGEEINKIGRWYNNALAVVEANNAGISTLLTLRNLIYPSIYFRRSKEDTLYETTTDRLGWRTTHNNRVLLINDFDKAIRDGSMIIRSRETHNEMTVFIYDDNNDMKPQSKMFHDDCIFASAVAYQGFKIMYPNKLEQIDFTKHLPSNYSY